MRVLLTAFEPYAEWPTNSSWLSLVEVLKHRPASATLTTRRYPVDFERLQELLHRDLAQGFDAILHLGQAPGAPVIRLESFALNIGGPVHGDSQQTRSLVPSGPAAYRSRMPLDRWNQLLLQQFIPTQVSYHAGTYLCNAIMYLTHHWLAERGLHTPVGFIHLPLATSQVVDQAQACASLPVSTLAQAITCVLDDMVTSFAELGTAWAHPKELA